MKDKNGYDSNHHRQRPAAEIRIGDSASLERTVTQHDIRLFAAVTGDVNPAHVDALYASGSFFHEIIAHGMLGGAWISCVLGTRFPGPGTIYLGQTLQFLKPVHIGDTLTVAVTVSAIDSDTGHVTLATQCVNQHAEVVIDGEARVLAPREKLRMTRTELAQPLLADKNLRYEQLLKAAEASPRIRMGVVHPCSREALEGAIDAARLGLIDAVLIGPEARIRALAAEHRLDLSGVALLDVPHSHGAAAKAVQMVHAGEVAALMKGSLHSDELLAEVVNPRTGLRTGRCISHVFVLDVPRYPKPLLITDAAINVAPDINAKADSVRNAINLAHALGITRPKVAILSAVETVTSTLPSSIAGVLPGHLGAQADGRVVVAHLGGGASMCAMLARKSVDTAMGFAALDGLMMGTRCGSIDPGVVLHLIQQHGMTAQAVEHMLYHQSGLLGVSGISGDMRVLQGSDAPQARSAINLYVHRIHQEIGSLAASLCGLDALVFTAGVGVHSALIRERVCRAAAWLGVDLDAQANTRDATCISLPGCRHPPPANKSAAPLPRPAPAVVAQTSPPLATKRPGRLATGRLGSGRSPAPPMSWMRRGEGAAQRKYTLRVAPHAP